jgi:hypothetical protein
MDAAGPRQGDHGNGDQVRAAIEGLTDDEWARLRRAARALKMGTEYNTVEDLLNEAVCRTMQGAVGPGGRHWPLDVPFVVYLVNTMSSIADASLEAPANAMTETCADPCGVDAPPEFLTAVRSPPTDTVVMEAEENAASMAWVKATLAAIDEHFADDEEVLMILLREREGQSPQQIQLEEGMTRTQYETARRRYRRGLSKLDLPRRQP